MAKWTFDEDAAQAAGRSGGISECGVYYGVFTEAKLFSAPNGAKGVEFTFEESDAGRKCRYIRVFTRKNDGDKAFGWGLVNALMGLLKLKAMDDAQIGEDSNGEPVMGFPALCDRPIGVMLQREEYWKNNGELGWKMNIVNFIDVQTNKTYHEMTNDKKATAWQQKIVTRPPQGEPPKKHGVDVNPASTRGDDLPF